jgi:hypothetical protein
MEPRKKVVASAAGGIGREIGCGFAQAALQVAELLGGGVAGTPRGVSDALADPIVQALMAADGIDAERVAALMRRMAARLARRDRLPRQQFLHRDQPLCGS